MLHPADDIIRDRLPPRAPHTLVSMILLPCVASQALALAMTDPAALAQIPAPGLSDYPTSALKNL